MNLSFVSETSDKFSLTYNGHIFSAQQIIDLAESVSLNIKKNLNDSIKHRIIIPTEHPHLFLASLFGCHMAGTTAVPGQSDLPRTTYQASGRIDFKSSNDHVEFSKFNDGVPGAADVGGIILSTTGSTGQPKGVALNLDMLLLNAKNAGDAIGINPNFDWCFEMELYLTSALCHLLMCWVHGAKAIYLKDVPEDQKFEIWKKSRENRVLGFGGSPIQLAKIAENTPPDLAPQVMMSSGDFLTVGVIKKIFCNLPEAKVYKFYGLTELSGRFCFAGNELLINDPDSNGFPIEGHFIDVQSKDGSPCGENEVGEVFAKGPMLMNGYIVDNMTFKPVDKNEWFGTGDKGVLAKDGQLFLKGRVKDSFKVGGEKVDRLTIERALESLLGKFEYCVLPYPHDFLGYCPALFVANPNKESLPEWKTIVVNLKKSLEPRFIPMLGFEMGSFARHGNGKLNITKTIELAGSARRIV